MAKNRKILFIIGGVIVAGIAWYLISPIFRVVELNEFSPLDAEHMVKDALDMMSPEMRAEFDRQTEAMSDKSTTMNETMPGVAKITKRDAFQSRAHDVKGEALLIETNGQRVLRFENFDTINGPDLRIYLSAGLNNDDFVDLGKIRATVGNVNYDVPANVDINKYRFVLVWCKAFSVLFSYAELK